MEMAGTTSEASDTAPLPSMSTVIPATLKPLQESSQNYSIITRSGTGSIGKHISLLANLFKVSVNVPDAVFYQYSVLITSEDKRVIDGKKIGRKVIDMLYQTYSSELGDKRFAYDGTSILYTVDPLPGNNLEFTVVLEESFAKCESKSSDGNENLTGLIKRSKHSFSSRTFQVELRYTTKISLTSLGDASRKADVDSSYHDALRVLDIILRQQAANRGCLLVRQSFFRNHSKDLFDVGGGIIGVRGFHSSFHRSQSCLSLNMDVSTTMILKPGPVIDFLLTNQNVPHPRNIDWTKAKKMLKNMRIKTTHRNMEFKIIGLSEKPCNKQFFSMKVKSSNGTNEMQTTEVTVSQYFANHHGLELKYSACLPCLDVGKPKKPNYVPLELCSLVSLQRYGKALSPMQRASLVEKSRQKPQDKLQIVTDALQTYNYDDDPMLAACCVSIEKQPVEVDGRVLETPKLKFGNNNDFIPQNGRWNFNNKTLLKPIQIDRWAIVNFSGRCDTSHISRELIKCGKSKGIHIQRPFSLIEEDAQSRVGSPVARVEEMFKQIKAKLPGPPEFILCVLPEKKNSDIYGPWKKKCLSDFGIVTQCISPNPSKINDHYLTNVLLKINAKLGGINSLLAVEYFSHVPIIKDTPTMILGMEVSHGSLGRADIPSVAAVVGSLNWPLISRYRASVRAQSSKVETIDALYKPLANGKDDGMIRELLEDFFETSKGHKPTQIIIFRDGVSESQFNQVLNIELNQIIKAYQNLGEDNAVPKFTVIVAQKNHHTKLFQVDSPNNIPPGTVVDTKIVHPKNYDFYMCSHSGMLGTSRPTHYHVLLDEIGFSSDELQNLIHSLCYVYQRGTAATSTVAPIYYAHLAAQQMGQMINFDSLIETSLAHGSFSSSGRLGPLWFMGRVVLVFYAYELCHVDLMDQQVDWLMGCVVSCVPA